MSAVCWMIDERIASVCSMSMCSFSEVYSPLRSLITPGTRTKSTRDAEVEAADDRRARQDQDREVTCRLDQMMRDRPATAQVAEAESCRGCRSKAGSPAPWPRTSSAIPPAINMTGPSPLDNWRSRGAGSGRPQAPGLRIRVRLLLSMGARRRGASRAPGSRRRSAHRQP